MESLKLNLEFPAIGQRIVRTVIGIFLCYLVYFLLGGRGNVFFAVLAVLQCIQPYMKSSVDMAKQRFIGTFIGAAWGLVFSFLTQAIFFFSTTEHLYRYLLIALFAGVVLYTSVAFQFKDVAGFSAIVFLSIATDPLVGQAPFFLVSGRFIDTMIGVMIAIAVNSFHFPRDRNTNILFVTGVDNILVSKPDLKISPYSIVELNQMIEHGMNFTISTWRTPASLLQLTEGINLNLPVVVMDGAAIYDMENHSYVETCPMAYKQAKIVMDFLEKKGVHYFTNVIVDDTLLIYYKEMSNAAEKGIYDELKTSPHRNYINRDLPEGEEVLYFYIINFAKEIDALYNEITSMDWIKDYRVEMGVSEEYSYYKEMKVFHHSASHPNMQKKLMENLEVDEIITFGSKEKNCDVIIKNAENDLMVKELKKLFEPIHFTRENIFRKRTKEKE